MQLHYFLHNFFYIFNFLTLTFYFFNIFYLIIEIKNYFLPFLTLTADCYYIKYSTLRISRELNPIHTVNSEKISTDEAKSGGIPILNLRVGKGPLLNVWSSLGDIQYSVFFGKGDRTLLVYLKG